MTIHSDTKRAALIATAITVPLILLVGLILGGAGNSNSAQHPTASGAVLPPVSVAPGEASDAATVSTCAQIISALPLTLAGADLRLTTSNPPSSSIVAWGDPAIVLRCGVAKPAALNPSLADLLIVIDGALFLPVKGDSATAWTIVDREVYVEITVPSSYSQPPLGPIATAIAKVLPKSVCVQNDTAPTAELCTRRQP